MSPGPIRVMIAEDEDDVRDALIALMEADEAIAVVGAGGDAEQAIAMAAEQHPDVAILDLKLPGDAYPRAAREITRVSPGTELIAVSANDDPNDVMDAVRGGWPERMRRIEGVVRGRGVRMVYQPIFDLADGRPVGAEALARFEIAPRRPPDVWFDEAGDVGLGIELELAVAGLAMQGIEGLDPGIVLGINVSPATCCSPRLRELLEAETSRRVMLEITEHAPVVDYEQLRSALEPLRQRGIELAIDDIGSGFANLRHVLSLRPDMIKLDITLTRGIERDHARRSLVEAIVGFAPDVGAKVLAEGVESAQQLRILRETGVEFGQGYFLGRPGSMPAAGTWPTWGGSGTRGGRGWSWSATPDRDQILERAVRASGARDVSNVLDAARRWQTAHPCDPVISEVIRIVTSRRQGLAAPLADR